MLELEIEGTVYKAPGTWEEITLGQFIKLCDIEIPEKLRALWVASAGDSEDDLRKAEDAIGVDELEKTFPRYYGKVMALLTDVPKPIIDRIHGPLREQFFNKFMRHFIYSTFATHPVYIKDDALELYTPDPVESFTLDGITYYMPETLHVYGEDVPLGKEQAVAFAEASDIEVALRHMAEGAANRLPMFVAIYCREKYEEYEEEATMERAKQFENLTMDMVWRVFFCIYKLLGKYQSYIQGSLSRLVPELAAIYGQAG